MSNELWMHLGWVLAAGLLGLIHLGYVTLSQRWVELQAEMGWTAVSRTFPPLLGDGATRARMTTPQDS